MHEELTAISSLVDAVGRAERACGQVSPSKPAELAMRERVAWRLTCRTLPLQVFADPLARRLPSTPISTRRASLSSEIVRLGKYSRGEQLKGRSYLWMGGRPATLKIWVTAPGVRRLGQVEGRVRQRIEGIEGYRAPALLGHGSVDEIDYVLEECLLGCHPRGQEELYAAVSDLLPALSRAYGESRTADLPLADVVVPDFRERLRSVLGDPLLPWLPEWGSRDRRIGQLDALSEVDLRLPIALCHGDLVSTNIIRMRKVGTTSVTGSWAA